MAGLVPASHVFYLAWTQDVDARHKAGHDNAETMLPDQKLNALVARHAALERDLSAALPAETYVKLSREFAELAPVVDAVKSYRAARHELEDLETSDRRSRDRRRNALYRRSREAGA